MLRTQIARGHLLPGTKLREEQVSAAFAISRNTVREAFRLLSHERLVVMLRLAFLLLDDRRGLHEPFVGRNRQLVDLLDAADRDGALAEIRQYLDLAERHLMESVK